MTVYLLKYNNYYNRIIKRWSSINELLSRDDVEELGVFQNVNFNPRDGVATDLTLNYDGSTETANYLVVEDASTNTATGWFIIDGNYIRLGQYQLTLRRDLVNDLWYDLAQSPVFVEKATLPTNNPLIFNRENMTYNQIKKSEYLLRDNTTMPWIVGYMAKSLRDTSAEGEPVLDTPTVRFPLPKGVSGDSEYAKIEDYPFYQYSNLSPNPTDYKVFSSCDYILHAYKQEGVLNNYRQYAFSWKEDGSQRVSPLPGLSSIGNYCYKSNNIISAGEHGWKAKSAIDNASSFSIEGHFKSYDWKAPVISGYTTEIEQTNQLPPSGKQFTAGGITYTITYTYEGTGTAKYPVSLVDTVGMKMSGLANKLSTFLTTTTTGEPLGEIEITYTKYSINITADKDASNYVDIVISNERPHSDTEYDIFCIPYGELKWGEKSTTSAIYGYRLAMEIMKQFGSQVYDLQLLPYCPAPQNRFSKEEDQIIYSPAEGDIQVGPTNDTSVALTGIIWVQNGDFSFTITAPQNAHLEALSSAIDMKIENETSIHRLTSPNYNGVFEFSAQKNGGVSSFDIDCSYKPFQPYVRISPTFGGLYGEDFNDARGLILGGDFSLPQTQDNWVQYQLQNKNYQVMFDRQINNMDANNAIQREREQWQVIAGTASAIATGAVGGSSAGIAGGIAGGFVGGLASSWAGAQDIRLAEQARSEARDYTMDQFGYQLGNIQAQPISITKVSAFNPNNKLFPILEYYSATDTEKEALRQKLYYNGMTVMTIGTIPQYLQTEPSYIKGKLIRFANDREDFHIVNALADELYQGVFV